MAVLDVSRKFGNNCTAGLICASLCSDWYIQVIVIVSAIG
jgi:hypothetical protein